MNMIGNLTRSTHQSLVMSWHLKHYVIALADLQEVFLYYVGIQQGWVAFTKLIHKHWKKYFTFFWKSNLLQNAKNHTKNQPFHFCAIWMLKDSTKCPKLDIPWKKDRPLEYCKFKFFISCGSFGILHCFMISYLSALSILSLVLIILFESFIISKKKDWRSLKKF